MDKPKRKSTTGKPRKPDPGLAFNKQNQFKDTSNYFKHFREFDSQGQYSGGHVIGLGNSNVIGVSAHRRNFYLEQMPGVGEHVPWGVSGISFMVYPEKEHTAYKPLQEVKAGWLPSSDLPDAVPASQGFRKICKGAIGWVNVLIALDKERKPVAVIRKIMRRPQLGRVPEKLRRNFHGWEVEAVKLIEEKLAEAGIKQVAIASSGHALRRVAHRCNKVADTLGYAEGGFLRLYHPVKRLGPKTNSFVLRYRIKQLRPSP